MTTEGKQNLINHLRFPMVSIDEIQSFQKYISSIIENIDYWTPLQELLLSDEYAKILMLKQRRLVNLKPVLPFEYSFFSPKSINPNYLFINKLNDICQNIIVNSETPIIMKELKNLILVFSSVLNRKKRIKYANWYCLNYKYKEFSNLLEILYKLDSYISIARSHIKLNLTYPLWIKWNDSDWGFKKLSNLLIENAVSNDLFIKKNTKVVFLTGPNMAGKSSIMTSLGQAIYMARCGLGVPATEAVIPWSTSIFTAFESSTSIEEGLSYFASEVKRSIKAVESAKNDNFSILLIDELFKGTNILDSQDCLDFFIEHLREEQSFSIVATHLIDYVQLKRDTPNTEYYNFEGEILANDFNFDYILKKGISTQRLGLNILKKNLSNALLSEEEK